MAITDFFATREDATVPFTRHFVVVPHDTNPIGFSVAFPEGILVRCLRCDADGTAILEDMFGTVVTYNVVAGERLEGRFQRLKVGSTAVLAGWV